MIIYADYSYVFDSVDFGIAVREWRLNMGMTQAELAAKLGYTSGAVITRIECGTYDEEIKLRTFMALCNWLDCSPEHFFTMQRA